MMDFFRQGGFFMWPILIVLDVGLIIVIERVIYLPVQRPTSCIFGGANLDQLFITSAWTGLSDQERQEQPFAGDLFLLPTDVQGQREYFFDG